MKHTAMVPKGFIRYHVLESLSEKPMSGSEIMDDIGNRTNGRWRPSPGSIYPLLAWLQDNGHVKEMPSDQSGLKRYELTDKGEVLLEEQKKVKKGFEKEAKFFAPPFLGALWFHIPPEKTARVRDSVRRVFGAFFDLGSCLEKKFSEQAIEEATKALDETAEKLEEITKKLKEKKYE
jgi:DNA-binding PadR family transcriptional regulator